MRYVIVTLCVLALALAFFSCAQYSTSPNAMSSPEYQAREEMTESLFKADQAVLSNEDIARILSTRVTLPANARAAVLRYGLRNETAYWSEEFARMDQNIATNFVTKLGASERLSDVALLPSMLIPKEMAIPYLREAAARFQADVLLVYRTASQTFSKHNVFVKDETRAYCIVEAVLLDVRTGIVVFSSVMTENFTTKKGDGEMNLYETTKRAEQEAVGKALTKIADDLILFLKGIPSPQ